MIIIKSKMILLVSALFFVINASEGWKTVCGEMSIISQMKNGISRNDVRAVLCFNSLTGEVRFIKQDFAQKRMGKSSLVTIREPKETNGSYDIIFAEHTLITGITENDIDGESLFGPFLLNKKTGEVFRLLTTISNGKITIKWVDLPKPSKTSQGEWVLSGFENTITPFQSSSRQNLYSLFLVENMTGDIYRVDSYLKKQEGISDSLVPIISAPVGNSTSGSAQSTK